jgi:hypothetical protein
MRVRRKDALFKPETGTGYPNKIPNADSHVESRAWN